MKTLYLHIGTHKTGSTSLQKWLSEHEPFLNENGYGLYKGKHNRDNHVELYLAAMRYNRDSFRKQSMPTFHFDDGYTRSVAKRVQGFISAADQRNLIMTSEGLSLLRHDDEIQRLRAVLGSDCEQVKIILYLRNKKDYLRSYRLQLQKKKGRSPSKDYWSALYVEDDTWLIDYQQLIDAYGGVFGFNNLRWIDYDQEMSNQGNIIPSFIEALGLSGAVSEQAFESYRYNRTLGSPAKKRKRWPRCLRTMGARLGR